MPRIMNGDECDQYCDWDESDDVDGDGIPDDEEDYKILLGMGMCGVFGVLLAYLVGVWGFIGGYDGLKMNNYDMV